MAVHAIRALVLKSTTLSVRGSVVRNSVPIVLQQFRPHLERTFTSFTKTLPVAGIKKDLHIAKPFSDVEAMSECVKINTDSKHLELILNNGRNFKYPFAWLRDNCQCPKCFEPSAKARFFLMKNLNPDIEPKEVKLLKGGRISVTWPDGHESAYESNWLLERQFTQDARQDRLDFMEKPPDCWGSELQGNVPAFSYVDILKGGKAMFEFLMNLETKGIALLQNAPCEMGQVKQLADKVAYLKNTNYGPLFTVKSKLDPNNLAYTSATLGLHTDLPFYNYMPGVQMLHCLKQAGEGGENMFTDAFLVVEQLKAGYPEYHKILTTERVDFYDAGAEDFEFHMLTMVPIIQLKENGQPYKINYNNQVRDSFLGIPLEKVHLFYKALCKFEELLMDQRNKILHKLNAGEIVCFHNYRVMHGRLGYTMESGTERHLEGGYLDWDELRSARRVLENKLKS